MSVDARAVELPVSNPVAYRFTVGEVTAVALSDGQGRFPAHPAYAVNATQEDVEAALRSEGLDPHEHLLNITALLLLTPDRTVLVDAGAGTSMGDGFGLLPSVLRTAGMTTSDIDVVHVTHAHLDHIGGLMTPEGDATFPSAQLSMSRVEWDYWTDPDLDLTGLPIDEAFHSALAAVPRAALPLYAGRVSLFTDETVLAPGISAIRTGGHTPGHSVVQVDSAGDRLLVVGDLVHHPVFDVAHPDWCTAFENRPDLTPALRRRFLGEAADRGDLIFACHAPFPGVGRVFRDGSGFRFAAAAWQLRP